jgi:Zn-dependent protease with chaperone function
MAGVVMVVLVGALAGMGCGAVRPGGPDATRLARLEAAGRALGPGPVRVGLAGRPGLGAWAWPDGRIRVTPALVDALDGDALAAVLAHERGHLQAGDAGTDAAAIGGDARDLDAELAADAAGCALLAAHGVPPQAMVRVLETLARDGVDVALRLAAAARVCRAD